MSFAFSYLLYIRGNGVVFEDVLNWIKMVDWGK